MCIFYIAICVCILIEVHKISCVCILCAFVYGGYAILEFSYHIGFQYEM